MGNIDKVFGKTVDMMDNSIKMMYLWTFFEILFGFLVLIVIAYFIRKYFESKDKGNDEALFEIIDKRDSKENIKTEKSEIEFLYNQLNEDDKKQVTNFIKKRIYEYTIEPKWKS